MNVTTFQIELLSNLLNSASLRQKVIANNVANVNTPGYKRLEVSFSDSFLQAVDAHGGQTLGQAQVVEDPLAIPRVDGNTVDIDQEMNTLNRNALLYETLTQIIASRIASLRSSISGQ